MGQSGKSFLRRQLLSRGRKDKKALPAGSGGTICKTLKVCACEELPVAGRSLWLGLSWKGGCIAEEPAKESRFA